MSDDLFRLDRPFHQLDGFYTEWSRHLTERCLPPLRDFPTDAKNDAILRDIHSYYETLDYYANNDTILYFLFPSWRSNSLETPILFLGDIHPRLFTRLVQSFIDDDGLNQDPIRTFSNLAVWEDLSSELGNTINGTVSRLLGEMREAQDGFIRRFSDKWVSSFLDSQSGTVLMEATTSVTTDEDGGPMVMEELVRIFCKANELRKNTITSIAGVLNMNQRALFLESVCKFLAGFKHQDQAFQNSIFRNHLIVQGLPPNADNLIDPYEDVNAHQYPLPMMQYYAPPFLRHGQLVLPFAPFGVVMAYPTFHHNMMQQYAPQHPPPPPMNQHHQQHIPNQDHVLYVGNLAPEATAELLLQLFSRRYHSVGVAKICVDKKTGHTYGFVSFADEREKVDALQVMNRTLFLGRQMHTGDAAKNTI